MQALQQRPEVQALQDQVTGAEKFSHAELDLWKPTINALGTTGIAPVRTPQLSSWYGAVGVNINVPVFSGFLFDTRAKTADLQTENNSPKTCRPQKQYRARRAQFLAGHEPGI